MIISTFINLKQFISLQMNSSNWDIYPTVKDSIKKNIYFNLKNLRLLNELFHPIVIYILLFSDLIRIFKWCSFPWLLHRAVGPEILFSFALLQNPLLKKKRFPKNAFYLRFFVVCVVSLTWYQFLCIFILSNTEPRSTQQR